MSSSEREPSWYERSSWAMRDWKAALDVYFTERAKLGYPWRPDTNASQGSLEREQALADSRIAFARADYRSRILSWYRKLCTPFTSPDVIPNEVASLMFEQWDLDGCDVGDAINL